MNGIHVKQRDGRTFTVSCEGQNELTIGRVIGNDVMLADQHVSRRHSRIVLRDGKYIIVDLKSSNGTFVNGKRISSPQVLKDNDKIYIGDFTLSLTARSVAPGIDGALATGAMPPWMRAVDDNAPTVLIGERTRAPAAPTPANAGDDEVTPAVGMAPSPAPVAAAPAPPRTSAMKGGRTVIDDDAALGFAPVPLAPSTRAGRPAHDAALEVRVSGVTIGERVRDDGMLVVHRGKASGREARIVQLSASVRDEPEFQAMLRDAIKLTSLFRSPRLPRTLASDSEPAMLATSPPPGVTVHDVITQHGALAPNVALHIARELARSLAEFHEVRDEDGEPLALVHRAVALKNVELAKDGTVQLDGFLLATMRPTSWRAARTLPGMLKGELPYMAPEQIRGLRVDARADVWGLGVCLYTMASGAQPFVGETPFDVLELVRDAQVAPLDAAPSLQPVIDALLVRDREHRTQTARDAIALLEEAALSLPPASRLDVERLLR